MVESKESSAFISGLDLAESFYDEIVKPILNKHFAAVPHAAALIGDGSEVLGFDTAMSTDHDWGPRVLLFLNPADFELKAEPISRTISEELPHSFRGYPTGFTAHESGSSVPSTTATGPIAHSIEIYTLAGFVKQHLNFDIDSEIEAADWLTFPEQKLATLVSGRMLHDGVGLASLRERFAYYPKDVWLYLLAAAWNRIEQEEHLTGRAGFVGDEIGSSIIAARLVRDLMRLCFLMERKYSAYPKWFGTAFSRLKVAEELSPALTGILHGTTWQEREKHLCLAYECVAKMHNALKITEALRTTPIAFHDRPFRVISMGTFSGAIRAFIQDPLLRELPARNIGAIDQWSDSTDILSDAQWRPLLREFYVPKKDSLVENHQAESHG